MNMSDNLKLVALECALEKHTKTLSECWKFAMEKSSKKFESKGEPKTEFELALDAFAAFSFACGMTSLQLLENEKLIVVSPSQRFDAACRLAATPCAFIGMKAAIDEILSIAKKNVAEVKVEES